MELGIGHLLKDRMASLCANDILADVEFIVGTPEGAVAAVAAPPMGGGVRTIPAHKCILVTSSSVFYAMFCGGLANRSKGEVFYRRLFCLPLTGVDREVTVFIWA